MFRSLSLACAVGVAVAGAGSVPALGQETGTTVTIARAQGDALVLWDATLDVAQIVRDHAQDADANARLERGALRALAQKTPQLGKSNTITVRVLYSKTGDVSPVYGTPTFAGIEVYATLKISTADAKADKGKWKEAGTATAGPMPASVAYTVTGQLPPR